MARYTGPRFKVARRFGVNVYDHPKALKRGVVVPRKQSEYGKQLIEKQKLKEYYGVLEKQFFIYVEKAMKAAGNSGDNLVISLEQRLDNVVYRLGFASTLRQARQMVVHGHITVNGKKVDKPSVKIDVNDVVALKEKSRNVALFKENFDAATSIVPYMSKDTNAYSGQFTKLPEREEIPIEVIDSLIIEYYSK